LNSLWKRGQDFLGVETPILTGAMTWISDSAFTAAVSNHGAFGCLADPNPESWNPEESLRLNPDEGGTY